MSNSIVPLGSFIIRTITIPNAGTDSTKVNLGGMSLVGIYFPAMTGTQVTVKSAPTFDGTYVDTYLSNGTSLFQLTVGATARMLAFNSNLETAVSNIQLVAASSQAAERTIQLILKGI